MIQRVTTFGADPMTSVPNVAVLLALQVTWRWIRRKIEMPTRADKEYVCIGVKVHVVNARFSFCVNYIFLSQFSCLSTWMQHYNLIAYMVLDRSLRLSIS
eukprot:4278723-Amphidinium_carterae.1